MFEKPREKVSATGSPGVHFSLRTGQLWKIIAMTNSYNFNLNAVSLYCRNHSQCSFVSFRTPFATDRTMLNVIAGIYLMLLYKLIHLLQIISLFILDS